MEKEIDLTKITGFTLGDIGNPPYTLEQYEKVYQNKQILQREIDLAHSEGYTKVTFKKVIFNACYEMTNDAPLANLAYGNSFVNLRSDTTYDFSNSVIIVIYDSDNKSPYHTTIKNYSNSYQLGGRIIILDGDNIKLRNLEVKGDIYNRSFINILEKKFEFSTAVSFSKTSNSVIEDCSLHGFMGDSLTGGVSSENLAKIQTFLPGYLKTTGEIDLDVKGAYITNYVKIDVEKLSNYTGKLLQLRRKGGYDRTPIFKFRKFEILWYTEENTEISRNLYNSLERMVVPYRATQFRVQIFNETPGLPEIDYGLYSWYLCAIPCDNNFVQKCRIFNNHRGGISNFGNSCVIENNIFYNNGLDSNIGAPLFPDTTRYQINMEDAYCERVIIRNNVFTSGHQGVLVGAEHIEVTGNKMTNSGGIIIYRNTFSLVDSNIITCGEGIPYAIGFRELTEDIHNRGQIRNSIISNNYIDAKRFDLSAERIKTKISFINNIVYTQQSWFTGGENATWDGNKFYFNMIKVDNFKSVMANMFNFNNNYIENITPEYMHSNYKIILQNLVGSGNIIKNINIGHAGKLYGENIYDETGTKIKLKTKGVHFINCPRLIHEEANNNDVESVEYILEDCIYENSPIVPYANKTEDRSFTSTVKLRNCDIINTSNVPELITYKNTSLDSVDRKYHLHLDNVSIESIGQEPYLVSLGKSNTDRLIKVSGQNLEANYDITKKITVNGKL